MAAESSYEPPLPPPTGLGDKSVPPPSVKGGAKLESVAKLSYRSWLWLQHHTDGGYASLARFILSGGPDNIFVNKPLKSSAVAFQLKEMYATGQGRPALTYEIVEQAENAIKAYRDDDRTVEDLMTLREAEDKAAGIFVRELENQILKDALEESGIVPQTGRSGREVLHTKEAALSRVNCTHVYRGGKQCTRLSVTGFDRCDAHGGLYLDAETVRHVLMRGQEKIVAASDAAIDAVIDLMQNSTQDAIRLKAAEMMLDRAGYRPGMEITITGESTDGPATTPAQLLRERLDRLRPSSEGSSGTHEITTVQGSVEPEKTDEDEE